MVDQQVRPETHVGDEQHRSAYSDPLTPLVLLQRTARVFPSKEAVVYGDERMNWADFADFVGRFAGALKRDGIGLGDRVAVLHSGRTDRERSDEHRRIREGRVDVAIGARSCGEFRPRHTDIRTAGEREDLDKRVHRQGFQTADLGSLLH